MFKQMFFCVKTGRYFQFTVVYFRRVLPSKHQQKRWLQSSDGETIKKLRVRGPQLLTTYSFLSVETPGLWGLTALSL